MSFRVCRVCQKTEEDAQLTSIFAGLGEKADVFMLLANLDISEDEYKVDALICDRCWKCVMLCYEHQTHIDGIVKIIKDAEETYFRPKREALKIPTKDSEVKIKKSEVTSGRPYDPNNTKYRNPRFECSVCKKTFGSAAHLRSHEVIHSDDRPFACDKCGKTYKRFQVLKNHINNKH